MPSVLIAIGWIALWYVWPSGEMTTAGRRRTETSVWHTPAIPWKMTTHQSPFGEMAKAMELADGSEELALTLVSPPARPHFLERTPEKASMPSIKVDPQGVDRTPESAEPFRPQWEKREVFSMKPAGTFTLRTEVSGLLRRHGFSLPATAFDFAKQINRPFRVVVFVDMNKQGEVEDVFLETSSDTREIDAAVIRAVFHGTVSDIGPPCSGRVAVNWGK